ncbi:MAG TPA: dienelactone hydrolase family protein [Jatrophihabitantaceae bacterium]|jgi:carboxymethylenebutenolidase|nr:dienelactone hydrolase family protein [Jatrophihabitantaceae bacterium]
MAEIALGAVPGGSERLRGYIARPEGGGPWPGVVVIHEAYGLDDVMRRQADRLAAAGYLALLPDLYSDGGALRCVLRTMRTLVAGRGKALVDIEAARQWLMQQGDCTGRVGIIGFCMGGGFALLTAGTGFDVASANYALLPRDADAAFADSCPIVASYGAKEPGATRTARRLERQLSAHGVEHDVKVYSNAGHSFLNDAPTGPLLLRPLLKVAQFGPEPESAKDAWNRIEEFFAAHLRGET